MRSKVIGFIHSVIYKLFFSTRLCLIACFPQCFVFKRQPTPFNCVFRGNPKYGKRISRLERQSVNPNHPSSLGFKRNRKTMRLRHYTYFADILKPLSAKIANDGTSRGNVPSIQSKSSRQTNERRRTKTFGNSKATCSSFTN